MRKQLLMSAGLLTLVALLTAQAFAREITVRGRLGRTIEAGGWLIHSDTEKYLILNPQAFQKEAWFREAVSVEATGETKLGTITIYQEGIPFEVRSMRPLDGSATSGSENRRSHVLVIGNAIVQAQPDTAILVISVVTQRDRALEAQQENANRSDAVIRAVKAAAGPGAEVKTSGYVLTPQRVYKQNQPPTITGYEARNTVTATMSDLTKVGAVIDAAAQAGANNIDSVSFTLRKDRPAREQALSEATREAMGKARAIAQTLGGRVVRVVEVREEGTTPRPVYQTRDYMEAKVSSAQTTPIEIGTLDIRSQVQLLVEIETVR